MEHQSNSKTSPGLPNGDYGPTDVLLGRSSSCYNHPGNIQFRKIIEGQAYIYKHHNHAYTRNEKARHVSDVIDILRSRGSRFLRYENGKWKQVDIQAIREKVRYALRDQSTQQSRQKANELSKQKYMDEDLEQTYGVKGLMARQQPSALELRHLFSDNASNNNILLNENNENNPMTTAAESLPTINNKASFPLALPNAPPAIGALSESWSGRAPPLTAAASFHQTAATGALPDALVSLPGTAASVGTLPATLSTVTASPTALPPTAQPETLLLLQQSLQQLSQVEHIYNNLRSNIETTVNLLQQVGESTSQQQQQISQQHPRELSHQLVNQQQSTVVAVPYGNNKKPWEDDQQPSITIKVSKKTSTSTSRRRKNKHAKKRRRRLGSDAVRSKSNQATEGVISLGDDGGMLEMEHLAVGDSRRKRPRKAMLIPIKSWKACS